MKNSDSSNRSLGEKIRDFFTGDDDQAYRTHHERTFGASGSAHNYDQARPAYQFGHTAALDDRYQGRSFDDAETDLRSNWETQYGSQAQWDDVRPYARDAFARGTEQRLTLSEEQLAVGKRQVQAGEVSVRKTVDTERVQETVGLTHEEVTIERHPISADAARNASIGDIGEETIRVPLMAEEAVVDKRVVPVEEVVLRKNAVTENQTIEDSVRRERLVTDGLEAQGTQGLSDRGTSRSGMSSGAADRGTDSGLLDRAADKLDNLKDRVDGNPASRPGPDATDRRI